MRTEPSANPVLAALRSRAEQPLRDDDPDLLVGYVGADPDPEWAEIVTAGLLGVTDDA